VTLGEKCATIRDMNTNRSHLNLPGWFSVKDAAEVMDITQAGVRKRIEREKIQHKKDKHNRTLVYVTEDDVPRTPIGDELRDQLIETLRGQVARLSRELEDWKEEVRLLGRLLREANERDRENRRIIAELTALSAARGARGHEEGRDPQ
jgi:hypothetical protein